ncbi:ABC transporter permease [soil metagenome]
MLLNYLKIAFRSLRKNKGLSFIQISGLAVGISVILVLGMLVHHEFSYDTFHKEGEKIYRVVSSSKFGDEVFPNSGVPAPLGEAVKNDMTGLKDVVKFHIWDEVKVKVFQNPGTPKSFKSEGDIIFTDANYFTMFSYEWLAGSPSNALDEPFKVVLTESKAKEYFGYVQVSDVIGNIIYYQDSIQATVTGIVKDHEKLSDFTFRDFISFATIDKTYLKKEFYMDDWDNISSYSMLFVKLEDGVEAHSINESFSTLLKKYLSESNSQSNKLQPLHDIHFNEEYDNFERRTAHKPTLYGLLLLSFFILMLACINFINLTTAQSSTREKEISVRKTLGSSKKQLVYQFLGESLIKTTIATVISILLIPFIFSHFSDYLPKELFYQNYTTIPYILILIVFTLITAFLAGLYPAFILAAFRPAWLLKGKFKMGESRLFFRQSLMLFQFAIAFCLIIGSFAISQQIKYGLSKDLGYAREGIVNIHIPWKTPHVEKEKLLHKLYSIPDFNLISLGGQSPASHGTISRGMGFPSNEAVEPILAEFKYGDIDYLNIYNLKIIAGNPLAPSDTLKEVIINETFAKKLGNEHYDDLVGQMLKIDEKEIPIAGIVADFHSKSMHQPVGPLILTSDQNFYNVIHIKLSENISNWSTALSKAENAWHEVFPDERFDYQFFDEKIASFYNSELKLNKLLNWATGIAIFISCLGLVGIVAFTIQQKTKEIGIRKVLGASISGILMLLSKDFIKLILLAFIIATPIGYYFIHIWLENFAYKIELHWWLFVLPGIGLLAISLLVLSVQSIKAALANPVESLRNE